MLMDALLIRKIICYVLILFTMHTITTALHAEQLATATTDHAHAEELLAAKQIIAQQQNNTSTAMATQQAASTEPPLTAASVDHSIIQLELPALNSPVID